MMVNLEELAAKLEYDPNTGLFKWLDKGPSNRKQGWFIGYVSKTKYATIRVKNKLYLAHRLGWFLYYGEWPKQHLDHIDGDTLNNKISNLRDVSRFINIQNQRNPHKDSKSPYLGVSWNNLTNSWKAQIYVEGKQRHIGLYQTPEDAQKAYLREKEKHHCKLT